MCSVYVCIGVDAHVQAHMQCVGDTNEEMESECNYRSQATYLTYDSVPIIP